MNRFTFFIFLSLFFTNTVLAVTTPQATPAEIVQIAAVDIDNAVVVSQKDNTFNISFTVANGEGVQTGVQYGVKLISDTAKGQFVVDEKVYEELLTLNQNSTLQKEIVYTAPDTLSGKYKLLLSMSNENGFPFALSSVGDVTLTSTTKGLQLMPESCSLQIEGKAGSRDSYSINKVVSITPNQSLRLSCVVENSQTSSISATPTFETRYMNAYGNIVETIGGDTKVIYFESLEKKGFSIILPKSIRPQVYNLVLMLKDGENLSNKLNINYVVKGARASIDNISLDKDFYNKKDTATISLIYSSATATPISLNVSIKDDRNKSCAKDFTQVLPQKKTNPITEVPLSINRYCYNPNISITLSDDKGVVLDQKDFQVDTTSSSRLTQLPNILLVLVVIVILFVLVVIYMYFMKRKNKKDAGYMDGTPNITMKSLLFFILLAGSFGIYNTSSASTFDVINSNGETIRFIVDINKTSFLPTPENIYVTGYAYSWASTDNIISLSVATNGTTASLFNSVSISPSSYSSFYDNNLTGLSYPGSSSVVFSASVYAAPPPPPTEFAYVRIFINPGLSQRGSYQRVQNYDTGLTYPIALYSGVDGYSNFFKLPPGPYVVLDRDIYCYYENYDPPRTDTIFPRAATHWDLYSSSTFRVYANDNYTMEYACS